MTYLISDLERITGIKAHTIRIWEHRYNFIKPSRTLTNIRYYDDSHVRQLLNIATLLSQGYKISQLAALTQQQVKTLILKLYNDKATDINSLNNISINDLIDAALSFDEHAFEKVFSAAILRIGLHDTILNIAYPFLKKLGVLWSCDKLTPLHEHFSSNILRRKLIAAIDGLPSPNKNDKSFLLYLPDNEWHEIPLLFADYLIRSCGYKSIYFGQNVPFDNLLEVINIINPTHILTLFISTNNNQVISKSIELILKNNKNVKLLIGGTENLLKSCKSWPRVTLIASPDNFKTLLLDSFLKNSLV